MKMIDEPYQNVKHPPEVVAAKDLIKRLRATTEPGEPVYVSAPMTDTPDDNVPWFRDVTDMLREEGFVVISPLELDEDDPKPDYKSTLERDIEVIIETGAHGVVHPYYDDSFGCGCEINQFLVQGSRVFIVEDMA